MNKKAMFFAGFVGVIAYGLVYSLGGWGAVGAFILVSIAVMAGALITAK